MNKRQLLVTEKQKMEIVKNYRMHPYDDVLEITFDDGLRWDDYYVCKDPKEAGQIAYKAVYSNGQTNRFRIKRNGEVILGDGVGMDDFDNRTQAEKDLEDKIAAAQERRNRNM